jgi:hypothetical protein
VDPRAGLDDMDKRKFLILPALELRPLGRPAHSVMLNYLSTGTILPFYLYSNLNYLMPMIKLTLTGPVICAEGFVGYSVKQTGCWSWKLPSVSLVHKSESVEKYCFKLQLPNIG